MDNKTVYLIKSNEVASLVLGGEKLLFYIVTKMVGINGGSSMKFIKIKSFVIKKFYLLIFFYRKNSNSNFLSSHIYKKSVQNVR